MDDRLSQLRATLKNQKLDAIFVSSLPNITYLTGFSGFSTEDRDAFLLITPKNQYIFTHGIYKEAVEKNIKNFRLVEMKRESPVNKSLQNLISKHAIKNLGYEDFDLRVSEYNSIQKIVNEKILKPSDSIAQLRIIKTPDEINSIKKACVLGDKTYSSILNKIRIDISEEELAFEIDLKIRKLGAVPSFPTIVAFASNSSLPHHVPTNKKLDKNMFVLMDFGVKLNNYCSDITRTIFFGHATAEQKKVYQTVLESQNKAVQQFKNLAKKQPENIKADELDLVSRNHIISSGYPTIPHSLGHGIGLEVHEHPRLTQGSQDILKNGMVFSIEPGIYLPGKFGVRIEDLYAIENNKLMPLTNSPKQLIEI